MHVVIRHHFPKAPKAGVKAPWRIITSVASQGNKYPPLTLHSRVRADRGRIMQPLGLGR